MRIRQKQTAKMTIAKIKYEDYRTAYTRLHECRGAPLYDTGKGFMEYLGLTSFIALEDRYFQMPEEAAHRLRLLLSPHYKTIVKAYKARQEEP